MEANGQLHARPLYPQEKSPWNPLDKSWMDASVILDAEVKQRLMDDEMEVTQKGGAMA
jgi:hypothetical protein